jgi:hypothetical protein
LCTAAEGMPVKPSVKALHAMAVAATNRADLDMAQPVDTRARWSKSLCVSQSASSSSLPCRCFWAANESHLWFLDLGEFADRSLRHELSEATV